MALLVRQARHRNKRDAYVVLYGARMAHASLRFAQGMMVRHGLSKKALRQVRSAMKSLEGAIRHWQAFVQSEWRS